MPSRRDFLSFSRNFPRILPAAAKPYLADNIHRTEMIYRTIDISHSADLADYRIQILC